MIPLIAPDFAQWLPAAVHPLVESGILPASVSALVLNAFFNGADAREAGASTPAPLSGH